MEEVQISDVVGIDIFRNFSYDMYSKVIEFDLSYIAYES